MSRSQIPRRKEAAPWRGRFSFGTLTAPQRLPPIRFFGRGRTVPHVTIMSLRQKFNACNQLILLGSACEQMRGKIGLFRNGVLRNYAARSIWWGR